jgi:hypothetical protein
MTTEEFIAMIGEAETGGAAKLSERLNAIGDHGLAGGYYQQHWTWRRDYWPNWAWYLLEQIDREAVRLFVSDHHGKTARELAGLYNLGHAAPDPAYDQRCLAGLERLGLDSKLLDEMVLPPL